MKAGRVKYILGKKTLGLSLVMAMSATAAAGFGYDVIDVEHGGVVQGTVTLDGPVPEPKGFNLITFPDPQYCGRISNGTGWRLLHDFVVSPKGGLKDAIVLLEGVEAGKPFEVSVPLIEARDCMFQPFMTIVRNGHAVEVVNMDPVMHDIQGYETSLEAGARVLFNTPLVMNHQHNRGDLHAIHNHAPGKSLVGPIYLNKGRRTFYMQCGFHAYMESWAMAVNNPYYALTDENGNFSLEQIPPGTYQLVVWHPQTGPGMTKMVTVKPDGKVTEYLSLPAPKGPRSAYKVVENPRFGPESLGRSIDIDPFVEHQH
ncbi:MAG TPA: carboxypeptidase-like regulatory domain-containing protein [Nitrospira sp.]|nr:carboxypeptidase-like regulatory domain-containing protein [Nitrospira sp.]